MSTISTRPRVKSVVNARNIAGAVLVAELLRQCAPAVAPLAREALRLIQSHPLANTIQSIGSVLTDLRSHRDQRLSALKLDARRINLEDQKISLLAALAEKPLWLDDRRTLDASLLALHSSRTLSQALSAQEQLIRTVVSSHRRIFTDSLTAACTNAFRKIGFQSVEILPAFERTVRLVATNPHGKTLVTEIQSDAMGESCIATEVVSGCDSQTTALLDAFDKALEEEGVRSGAPERKGTGGICQLKAATDWFMNLRPLPANKQSESQTTPTPADRSDIKRLRRLNNRRANARNRS